MITDFGFLNNGQPWPPEAERDRLDTYRQNRLLFEGKHDLVYRDALERMLREDEALTLVMVLNWPKRIATLWADMLLGEPPTIVAGAKGSPEQVALERIMKDNDLLNVAYEVALDVPTCGTGIFKVRFDGQRGIIESQPPEYWFPVVDSMNVKEIWAHVLAWVVGERLVVEIHYRGFIEHREYTYDDGEIGFLLYDPMVVETGVDNFLIEPVHNLLTSNAVYGLNDFDDLGSIVSEIEARLAQIAKILDKHADPSMYGSRMAMQQDPNTGKWHMPGGSKFWPVDDKVGRPGYVTWDGKLEAAFTQIETLMDQLYMLSETSPAAFGNIKQGLCESGSALKRLMIAPLAKVNRIRMRLDPALKRAIQTCAALEVAQGMEGAVELNDVSIQWQDGLPDDDTELTQNMVARKPVGLVSTESALKMLDGIDGEQLELELKQIAAERQVVEELPKKEE